MNNKTNNNMGNFNGPVTTTTPTHEELKETEVELKEKEVVKTCNLCTFCSLNQSHY